MFSGKEMFVKKIITIEISIIVIQLFSEVHSTVNGFLQVVVVKIGRL